MPQFLDPRLPERFWSKCIPEPNSGCWLWVGALDGNGYGLSWSKTLKKNVNAHRRAYLALVGDVADGLVLDHVVCDQTLCCNPAHLKQTTQRENVMRGKGAPAVNARKTHCPRGHELTASNTYVRPNTVRRECRLCWSRSGHRRAPVGPAL